MTDFEIAMLLVFIEYGIIFGIICVGLFSRIRRNDSYIEITNSRIDGIIDRIDFLVQTVGDEMDDLDDRLKKFEKQVEEYAPVSYKEQKEVLNIGDRVKFKMIGDFYNSGIIKDMDEKSYLIEVDKPGYEPLEDNSITLPYYVRVLSCEKIAEVGVESEEESRE